MGWSARSRSRWRSVQDQRPKLPTSRGALELIARAPLGRVALVVICLGLLAYAAWKRGQGVLGSRLDGVGGSEPWDRASNVAGGIVYLGFFAVAVRVLTGDGSSDSSEPRHAAAGLLTWPGGQILVGAAGVVLIAISIYQAYARFAPSFSRTVARCRWRRPGVRRSRFWGGSDWSPARESSV